MDYQLLASILNLTVNEAEAVMKDFISEVKSAWVSKGPFIYTDLVVNALPLKSFTSQYILDLIDGKTNANAFTAGMSDTRKANFAKIISYILDCVSREPLKIDDFGMFYLFGKFGKTVVNPQTHEVTNIPVSINLGFKPNF